MSAAIRDWRGPHGLWRVLEPTERRRNGYVVWRAICGGCNRLLTVRSDSLAKGSVSCRRCSSKKAGSVRHVYGGLCAICGGPKTNRMYCGRDCYVEANRRRSRQFWIDNKARINESRRQTKHEKKTSRGEKHSAAVRAGLLRGAAIRGAYDALVDLLLVDVVDAKRAREDAGDAAAAE